MTFVYKILDAIKLAKKLIIFIVAKYFMVTTMRSKDTTVLET